MAKRGILWDTEFLAALTIAVVTFNIFTGTLLPSPVTLTVSSLDQLGPPNGQPIIFYANGDPPINVTYTIATFVDNNLHSTVCYCYSYEWGPNPSHPANDWEEIYVYYDVSNPTAPALTAIAYRPIHFQWGIRRNNFVLPNNGTAPVVIFSKTYHIPATGGGWSIASLLRANNETTAPYNAIYDPNAPYSTGPNAYEAGSGPSDPAMQYGSTLTYANGILFATIAFVLVMGVFRGLTRLTRRKK